MPFHHEKPTVYKCALEFAACSQQLIQSLTKKTSTRDQLERSGDSIALNIAERIGQFSQKDRARFFQIAHGSALESAASLDLLVARDCCNTDAITRGKAILEEIVKMLFQNAGSVGCRIADDSGQYGEKADEALEEEED